MIDSADAVARFERSTRCLLDELEDVAEPTWRLRPTAREWSLADTVEHVVLANRGVQARLAQILAAPFPPDNAVPRAGIAAMAKPSRKRRAVFRTAPASLGRPRLKSLDNIDEVLSFGERETYR